MKGEEREGFTCYEVWVKNEPEPDDNTQHLVVPPAGDIGWLVSTVQLMRRGMYPGVLPIRVGDTVAHETWNGEWTVLFIRETSRMAYVADGIYETLVPLEQLTKVAG